MAQYYPSIKYHPTLGRRRVNTPEEHVALGPGWYESPADFPSAAAEAASVAETPAPEKKKPGPKPKAAPTE